MFYLNSTLIFGIPPVLIFQLEVYYMVDRLLTGLIAQQKGTTARWYSNKTSLSVVYLKVATKPPTLLINSFINWPFHSLWLCSLSDSFHVSQNGCLPGVMTHESPKKFQQREGDDDTSDVNSSVDTDSINFVNIV